MTTKATKATWEYDFCIDEDTGIREIIVIKEKKPKFETLINKGQNAHAPSGG